MPDRCEAGLDFNDSAHPREFSLAADAVSTADLLVSRFLLTIVVCTHGKAK